MAARRESPENRMKCLLLAMRKIEMGRTGVDAKLSVASIAREAGVTPALIHNCYPSIAAVVRAKRAAAKKGVSQSSAEEVRRKNSQLRKDLAMMKAKVAKIASLNEILTIENRRLAALIAAENVSPIDRGHAGRPSRRRN